MVLSVLATVSVAVVAIVALVLLNRQRRVFVKRHHPRVRLAEGRWRLGIRRRYVRVRTVASKMWAAARTAPFHEGPVAAGSRPEVVGAAVELAAARPSKTDNGPLSENRGRTLGRHAAHNVLHWISVAERAEVPSPRSHNPAATAGQSVALPPADPAATAAVAGAAKGPGPAPAVAPAPVGEGIVYVDATGRVTFANAAARALFDWTGDGRALSEVLAGGTEESEALLEAVARHELVQREITLRGGSQPRRLEISALALRDGDGNWWGAALFVRGGPPPG